MFRTSLICILVALAMQVNGKPACGCQTTKAPPPPPPPTTSNPCVAKQEVTTTTTSNPCVVTTPAPKIPEQCREEPATTTTTTTVAPFTSTAAPKTDCTNGDIYPVGVGGCNQFLMCSNRVYILMVCPTGLGFNFQTKSCERSDNVPACSA